MSSSSPFGARLDFVVADETSGTDVWTRIRAHGVAFGLAVVLAATVLRLTALQALDMSFVFLTFCPAVILAVLFGGVRAGITAIAASTLITDYFWLEPVGSLLVSRPADWLALAIYLGINGVVVALAGRLQASEARLRLLDRQRADDQDRRIAEGAAALSQTASIVRGIGENSPDPIYAKDLQGRFIYANPAVLAILGRSAVEVLDRTDVELHPDSEQAAAVMANDRRIMREGVAEVVEESWDAAGLGARIYRSAKAPLFLEDGSLAGLVGVSSDITEKKRAEQAVIAGRDELAAAKRQADEILASIPDGFAVLDAQWRFAFFNHRAEILLDKRRDEVIGRTFLDVFPLARDSVVHEHFRRAMSERRPAEFESISPILKRWVAFLVSPTADGGVSISFRDISEQKAAQEVLRERDNALRTLADAMAPLAWIADENGATFWYSQRWYDYTGVTSGEMGGWDWQSVHDPAVVTEVMRRWREAVATGRPFEMVFPLRGADGKFRPFLTRALPERDASGKVVRWFGSNTDISEQKALEEELRRARAEAERSALARSKFLAAASHDLRQPVQSLVLLLAILKQNVEAPNVVRAVDLMGSALNGLTLLLNSILDMSRLDAGVVMPQVQSVDVGAAFARLADEYAAQAAAKGLRLKVSAPPLFARTDPALLERALRNLIENALRYTHEGGILIGARRRGERVRIDVFDTGIGIAADKAPHIFEEFYQVSNPGRDRSRGLGLGLSIVDRIVRLLGAEVALRSHEGRGSCFSLLLPGDREPSSLLAAPDSLGAERGRVLVIDDEETVRNGLQMLLDGWGYETIAAASGEEALSLGAARDWRFDAIVSDYRLGAGLKGAATVKEMQARAGRRYPTIIITGDTAPERIAEIHASGFEVLHKPVAAEQLRTTLARLAQDENAPV